MGAFQLHIPEPCREDWENMTPAKMGRFCKLCSKNVIDFTLMSDTEIARFFTEKRNNNTCGRFYQDQLEQPYRKQTAPKRNLALKIAAAVALLISHRAYAKTKIPAAQYQYVLQAANFKNAVANELIQTNNPAEKGYIKGRVTDTAGNAVSFASVFFEKEPKKGIICDVNGNFTLKNSKSAKTLIICATGYEQKEIVLSDQLYYQISLEKAEGQLKEIITGAAFRIRRTTICYTSGLTTIDTFPIKTHKEIVLQSIVCKKRKMVVGSTATVAVHKISSVKILSDTISKFFIKKQPPLKIFPNPAPKGSNINLNLEGINKGNYAVVITDIQGKTILKQPVSVASSKTITQISTIQSWASGMYNLYLTNNTGEIILTGKFILQ